MVHAIIGLLMSQIRWSLVYLLISPQRRSNSQVFSLILDLMQVVISIPALMPSISPSLLLHLNAFIISSSPSPLPWLRPPPTLELTQGSN